MVDALSSHDFLEALYYLTMAELRTVSAALGLSDRGVKGILIKHIYGYVTTGVEHKAAVMPMASRARKGVIYPLAAQTLMLIGSYKNDHATRAFFKQLIGDHFHFTAAGIDWLKERWCAGNPPTYGEFAAFWQREYEQRTLRMPKQEWAYIRFLQRYAAEHPHADAAQIRREWHEERMRQVQRVVQYLTQRGIAVLFE